MRIAAIDKFNDAVIKKAIALVDRDKMAKELSKKIEKQMLSEFDCLIENGMNFEHWLIDELVNKETKAGKQFNKALEDITKRMADAI